MIQRVINDMRSDGRRPPINDLRDCREHIPNDDIPSDIRGSSIAISSTGCERIAYTQLDGARCRLRCRGNQLLRIA